MLNKKISRRSLIKTSTTGLMGLAAAGSALSMGLDKSDLFESVDKNATSTQKQDQIRFIQATLIKRAANSKTVTPEEIEAFAVRFTEVHGVLDYRSLFSNLDGEYRLSKIFVRSLRTRAQA